MSQTLELYWVSGSPYAWRVLLTLAVKGLSYTSRPLSPSQGDLRTPEFLRLNPHGAVPVLRDGDVVMYESLAIMAYLERKNPDPALFGDDALSTGTVWRVISEFMSYGSGPASRIITALYRGTLANQYDEVVAEVPPLRAELERFNRTLDNRTWLATNSVSAADIAIYPFVRSLLRAAEKPGGSTLDLGLQPMGATYPRVAAWMQEVERLPGYEVTFPAHWRTS